MSVWTTTAVNRAGKRRKASGVPVIAEKDVQRGVIDLLQAAGWIVVRVHVGMFKGWNRDTPVSMNKGKEGFPDLIAVCHSRDGLSRVLFIETKRSKGGKLSQQQEQWRDHLLSQGYEWVLVQDVQQLQGYLKKC